ncbi:MAG: hypothetical protein AAGC74_10720, partial [Verrucomicrobiota bacterium]
MLSLRRGRLNAFFALILSVPFQSLLALPQYPLDCNNLLISSFTDPTYPTPRIGERNLSITHSTLGSGIQSVELIHSPDPNAISNGTATVSSATTASLGAGNFRSSFMLPWSPPGDSHINAKPTDFYPSGTTVYYRWQISYLNNGGLVTVQGDQHQFTMPRRVIVAILGDSFGSGEGAPLLQPGKDPWQSNNEGERAHRSPISGQEIALNSHFSNYPTTAYDYVNLSSSGAIALDIYSNQPQRTRSTNDARNDDDPTTDENKPQGVSYVQADRLEQWLSARDYRHLDAIILSCGGNDLGFASILTNYLGLNIPFLINSALNALSNPGCITLGVAGAVFGGPVGAILAYTACVIPVAIIEITTAIGRDATFKNPYSAGSLSKFKSQNFSTYASNLQNQYYPALAQRLSNNLQSDGSPVSVANVLATEYPFPLKDCSSFFESPPLVKLVLDDAFIKIDISGIPVLSLFGDTIAIDISGIRPVTVGFSTTETLEASNTLAPPSSSPRPNCGGLNHLLKDLVQAANNA